MKQAVETEQRAIEIIQDWFDIILTDELMSTDTTIQPCSTRCACGETRGMEGFYEGRGKIGRVAICEGCGDDGVFYSEAIEII